jgi:hypothetical protein
MFDDSSHGWQVDYLAHAQRGAALGFPGTGLPPSHYIFVIQAPWAEFVRIFGMEEKPKSEAEMIAPMKQQAAASVLHIATELRERTKLVIAEELPDEIARVLAQLRTVTR